MTEATRREEDEDASTTARADRPPTPEEEAAADAASDLPDSVKGAYEEAIERGANAKGEGRID